MKNAPPLASGGASLLKGSEAMSETAALIARIDTLEMRLAEQERIIEDINPTILAQWKEIENLNRKIARLGAQMQEIEGRLPSQPDAPPPHY